MGGRPGDPRSTQRWKRLRAEVYRTESVCYLCGRAVDFDAKSWQPWAPNADHIIPVELRPDLAFERSNVRLAHRACNSSKRSRLPDTIDLSTLSFNAAELPPRIAHQHNHSRIWTEGHTLRNCLACAEACAICGTNR
jgi:5-methylcytosine-specific restriction endonuclease McrA